MKKIIQLKQEVKNNAGEILAVLTTNLYGDGSTPVIQTLGSGSTIIGYDDEGKPIVSNNVDSLVATERTKLMAVAIKEQKALCIENGVDPELVNIINAEKKVNK